MLIVSAGPVSVATTLSSGVSIGGSTCAIASTTGLPSIASGFCQSARILAEGSNTDETIFFTRSGSTLTLVAPGPTTFASAHGSGAAIIFDIWDNDVLAMIQDDAISGFPLNALSSSGALTAGNKANFVTATSGGLTMTLADGSYKGQLCRIYIDPTSTKLVTIDPAGAHTIAGRTTLILWAGEIFVGAWDGTSNWAPAPGCMQIPMIGELYLGSNVTSTVDSTETVVPLATAGIDNTGLMVNAGSNKITVQRPGNYTVSGFGVLTFPSAGSGNTQVTVKNGSTNVTQGVGVGTTLGFLSIGGGKPVTCAAADDFKMFYYQSSGGTTVGITGGRANTYLTLTQAAGW